MSNWQAATGAWDGKAPECEIRKSVASGSLPVSTGRKGRPSRSCALASSLPGDGTYCAGSVSPVVGFLASRGEEVVQPANTDNAPHEG